MATETVAGSHVLRIDNFSATKDLGVDKEIVSSTFRVAGHNWRIKCYPCGDEEGSAGWVSLYLVLDPFLAMGEVRAECSFTLIDYLLVGEPVPSKDLYFHTFSSTDDSMGTDFIERNKLESSHLKGDCFQVRCEVRVIKEFPPIPPPELHRHLGDLLASQVGGNVTFKIGNELFTAHRCVLAALPHGSNYAAVGREAWLSQAQEACVTLLKNLLASVHGSEGDTCSQASTTRKKQRSGY